MKNWGKIRIRKPELVLPRELKSTKEGPTVPTMTWLGSMRVSSPQTQPSSIADTREIKNEEYKYN
jgi:hypothetical protein